MKHKILFTSHTANFHKFNRPFMRWFSEQGWEVHYASAEEEPIYDADKHFKISFSRSPWSGDNIKAIKALRKLIEQEEYDIIHTHTPMGSVVTRLAARHARRKGYPTTGRKPAVIYTAHGFHFYRGAAWKNWLLYYPIEKIMSRYTDCLVTINREDYNRAVDGHFKAKQIVQIDGVGVNLERFHRLNVEVKCTERTALGFGEQDFLLICVAEFIKRKNHGFLIQAMKTIHQMIPKSKLLLVGKGEEMEQYRLLSEQLGLQDTIVFLGYRNDVEKLCGMSDVLVTASYQEGLAVNVLEGMAAGLPIICSDVRGQRDVITDGENGFLYTVNDSEQFVNKVKVVYEDVSLRQRMSDSNVDRVQRFSQEQAVVNMSDIYAQYMR